MIRGISRARKHIQGYWPAKSLTSSECKMSLEAWTIKLVSLKPTHGMPTPWGCFACGGAGKAPGLQVDSYVCSNILLSYTLTPIFLSKFFMVIIYITTDDSCTGAASIFELVSALNNNIIKFLSLLSALHPLLRVLSSCPSVLLVLDN